MPRGVPCCPDRPRPGPRVRRRAVCGRAAVRGPQTAAEGYVRRRDFIKIIAGSAAVGWPLAVQAPQPDRMRRVRAVLGIGENDHETKSRVRAFRLGMGDAGWIEGRNIQIEYRYSEADRAVIDKHVADLIRLAPDVILASSSPVMVALRPATNTIPIIFVVVNNPLGQGLRFKSDTARQQRQRFLIHRA